MPALTRVFGAATAGYGAAIAAAPRLLARAASDTADAVVFGTSLPDRSARTKAVAGAATWTALCAATAFSH